MLKFFANCGYIFRAIFHCIIFQILITLTGMIKAVKAPSLPAICLLQSKSWFPKYPAISEGIILPCFGHNSMCLMKKAYCL